MALSNVPSVAPKHPSYEVVWDKLHPLLSEHHLWTALWGFLVLCLVISAYKKLKSISPALIPFALTMVIIIMMTLWIQTRTEPKFLTPVINVVAHFFPEGSRKEADVPHQ